MSDRRLADGAPVGAFGVHGVLEVTGRRQDAEVDDEGVAVRLRGLVFVVGVADGSAVGEEDEAPQVIQRLAAVELPTDAAAERFVGEPAQGVKRPLDLPRFGGHGVIRRPGSLVERRSNWAWDGGSVPFIVVMRVAVVAGLARS